MLLWLTGCGSSKQSEGNATSRRTGSVRCRVRSGLPGSGRCRFASNYLKGRDGITDTTGMSITIPQSDLLVRLLDVASMRHRLISQNLANVNTPGYKQLQVSFEDSFSRSLGKQGEAGALRVTPRIVEGHENPPRQDGNTVDLDKEIGNLNKNSLMFSTAMQMLMSRANMMRSAITGR